MCEKEEFYNLKEDSLFDEEGCYKHSGDQPIFPFKIDVMDIETIVQMRDDYFKLFGIDDEMFQIFDDMIKTIKSHSDKPKKFVPEKGFMKEWEDRKLVVNFTCCVCFEDLKDIPTRRCINHEKHSEKICKSCDTNMKKCSLCNVPYF
jgi:hypothetical protein